MADYDAGVITTNGVDVPIKVDDNGAWRAAYAGKLLTADTRDKLKGKLARLTKTTRVEVSVPIIAIDPGRGYGTYSIKVKRGVGTGFHGANGNVLVTWTVRGKEVKEQVTSYGSGLFVAGDTTDEQLDEYNRIEVQLGKLRDERAAWLKAHQIQPKDVVQRAIDARLGPDTE